MTQSASARVHADLALAVYLEPLAEQRRVLLLGEAQGTLADRLDRAAVGLDIIDPAAREPSRGSVPELPFDDASFDLVVVNDFTALPDPRPDAVRELRRVLADDGILVMCAHARGKKRRRSGPLHVALGNLLASEFRFVRVLGEAPLFGYSLGEVDAARDDEFAVDSSLVRGQLEHAERFVAVGSDVRVPLESRLWVQVPSPELAGEEAGEERASPELLEALRKAEEEAREALHREADLLRELEAERRDRGELEHAAQRAKALERRLVDAEGDYDDAVARVRFLESELSERETSVERDRQRHGELERALTQAKAEMQALQTRVAAVDAERDAVRAEVEALAKEAGELEKRLVEAAQQVQELERDKKQHQVVARDLLEDLRRLEHERGAAVEHDARVAELEAERERAVQRALEAEVARESAQMRADELRAQLGAQPARGAMDAEVAGTLMGLRLRLVELEQELRAPARELEELRGERTGLVLRLDEAEAALRSARSDRVAIERAREENAALALKLQQVEAQLRSFEARVETAAPVDNAELDRLRELVQSLESRLARAQDEVGELERAQASSRSLETRYRDQEQRVRELERELEEADRFAEAHADDEERIDALETELEAARRRLDVIEDELRSTQDELRAARADAENRAVEASARVELAQRRELEARTERDDARAALEEARAILAQLAGRVGADASNPPSIVAAIDRGPAVGELDELRAALAAATADHSDRERYIEQIQGELADRNERIRQLELAREAQIRGTQPPQLHGPEAPETD